MSAYDVTTATVLVSQFGVTMQAYTVTTAGPVYTVTFRALPLVLTRAGAINNLTAAVAPGVGDDSGDGYGVLSAWYDRVANVWYCCDDATVGAAVWTEYPPVDVVAVTSPRPVALTEDADGRLRLRWTDDAGTALVEYTSTNTGATWA